MKNEETTLEDCVNYASKQTDVVEAIDRVNELYTLATEIMGSGKPLLSSPYYSFFMEAKYKAVLHQMHQHYEET